MTFTDPEIWDHPDNVRSIPKYIRSGFLLDGVLPTCIRYCDSYIPTALIEMEHQREPLAIDCLSLHRSSVNFSCILFSKKR
jgi:hypothetical protein